jgi:methylglutaconyl-CoA hydratase
MVPYRTVEVEGHGPVVSVVLNRPEVRNAFNAKTIDELTAAARAVAQSDARVVILSGRGRSFSAGADISWMRSSLDFTPEENRADAARMSDMFASIGQLPQPVIARVQGAALGGGMGLLAVADIVVAEEGTIFGFTETKLGIIPAVISRFVLPKIGTSWARALFLSGERFGVDVAREIGLVHWIAAEGSLDALVQEKVDELMSAGPQAVREAKALIAEAEGLPDAALRDLTVERIARLRASAEGQEGLRAFLEKRRAAWRTSPE